MTNEEKSSLINLLESYKPDGNYYDGYHNFSRQVDEAVCNCLDNVITEIKQMPTSNAWIKCSEEMPEPMRQVLFYDERFKDCVVGYYNKNYNAIQVGCALLGINGEYERFTHWTPLPELPKTE